MNRLDHLTEMFPRKCDVSIALATEECSCNSCGNRNYESKYYQDKSIHDIYNLKVGIMTQRLCKDCLQYLAYEIEDSLKDSINWKICIFSIPR